MNSAAVLRSMIEKHERELVALRDALEVLEAVDRQLGESDAIGTTDVVALSNVQKLHSAPTAGLYGEDGRAVLQAPMPREQRAAAVARHQEDIAARNDDLVIEAIREIGAQASVAAIAARTGIAATSLKRIFGRLKDARRLDIVGWARGRRYVLLDDAGQPVSLPDRVTPSPTDAPRPGRKRDDKPRRRFTDHAELEPEKVHGLAADHPALTEARTIFPSTVVDVRTSPRVLVSGMNHRKTGDRVSKGPWKGMPIYTLTLEERATCPTSCAMWSTCYGNGMPRARRHRHGPELEQQIETELALLQQEHPAGFVVRLHILGDFYSVEYVNRWEGWLVRFKALRVFGYTAWPESTDIGKAVHRLREAIWERFAVRTSREPSAVTGPVKPTATTIRRVAQGKQPEGIVCPAQTHDDVCCGSCGLCWSPSMKTVPVAFILHGRRSEVAVAEAPAQPEPKSALKRQPKARAARPAAPRDSVSTPAPAPVSTRPAAERNSAPAAATPKPVARPVIPYVPTQTDAERRAEEQAAIERFLATRGARQFEGRRGLLGMLEQAFAEEGIEIKEAYDLQAKREKKPYRLAGKLVTADTAIRHADVIRKRMGLPPIAAETMEAAE